MNAKLVVKSIIFNRNHNRILLIQRSNDDPYLIIAYICESQNETVALSNEHQAFMWADKEVCKEMLPKAIIDDFDKNGIFKLFCDSID